MGAVLWGWVTQLSGLTSLPTAAVLAAVLLAYSIYRWDKNRRAKNMPAIQLWHFWTVAIVGTWVFITATLGLLLYSILYPSTAQLQGPFEGLLAWGDNLFISPGPDGLIYRLGVRGKNTSQTEVI